MPMLPCGKSKIHFMWQSVNNYMDFWYPVGKIEMSGLKGNKRTAEIYKPCEFTIM